MVNEKGMSSSADGTAGNAAGRGRTLWLDCQAGVAGDMLVAALIDAAEDSEAAERAVRTTLATLSALADADIFIAIGTSGHVYPAAGFVHEARLHGAHTVELNLEPSQVGSEFEEKHYGLASAVVPEFVDKLLKGL